MLWTVPRAWAGETVVCMGGGPSLTQEDADYCRGRARVIAINDTVRLAPWCDVLYGCDQQWWAWHQGVLSYTGMRVTTTPNTGHWPDLHELQITGLEGLELDPSGLRGGHNGGYQAIGLAVHFGASRVLLLGYDMGVSETGRTHWHGGHPNRVVSPYATFRQAFETIVAPLQAARVAVINCSRRTALTVFPCQPLREALVDA